jgi:hypothetical protein
MTAKEFWKWFEKNNKKYLFIHEVEEKERQKFVEELLTQLRGFHEKLVFVIGGHPLQDHELIISADGQVELFDKVDELVSLAPVIKDWKIIACKPPMGFEFRINFEGIEFDPQYIWFTPLHSESHPDEVGVLVGIPDFNEARKEDFFYGALMLLESCLGERVCAHELDYIDVGPLPPEPEEEGYLEVNKLPEYLKWCKAKKNLL